ncbi:general transcription factor 3C polypeptide 6 [Erpetoichthys calabaricus]|uniref:General transcription factor 3C polypeptide 6 n=1 Tax=Erpetoichthys calabaricus TaxID=27687 RepID=A0A8C4SRE4_ERPCA|nr:general transcription factor 3C polypeptide 6 [Erpetoichthys calabaricus]
MADEWEVEDQLVVVELSGIIDSDFLTKGVDKCKILGIDSEQPIMQVGRYVFAGEYEDALGSCVIFDEKKEEDALTESPSQLKYKCHTIKKLMMKRTFLSEIKEGESPSEGIEVLQLTEDNTAHRSSSICNYLPDSKRAEVNAEDNESHEDLHQSSDSDDEIINTEDSVCCELENSKPEIDVSNIEEQKPCMDSEFSQVLDKSASDVPLMTTAENNPNETENDLSQELNISTADLE